MASTMLRLIFCLVIIVEKVISNEVDNMPFVDDDTNEYCCSSTLFRVSWNNETNTACCGSVRETKDTVNNTGESCCADRVGFRLHFMPLIVFTWNFTSLRVFTYNFTSRRVFTYNFTYGMPIILDITYGMPIILDITYGMPIILDIISSNEVFFGKVSSNEDDSQDAMDNEDFFILYKPVRHNCRSSSVPDDTKDRNSCGWFNFPIVSTLKLKTLTDGMRHNRLKIWTRHSRVKRETKDTVNNTGASCSNLYEYLCRELFAICGITMAIPLLTAIAMLTIAILVSTELQSISGWCKTRDMGNCQELITIWRKVKEFIKIIKPYPFIEWEICRPRCGNSSSAAEKQVVRALSTACIRQTFKRASKRHLGLKFLGAYSGSIIIRFVTEMGKSFQKVKDACVSGKIKEFLPNIFMGTGVESKLGEGDVMWKYYVYKGPLRSSGRNVDTARAAVTEIQEEILNPIKLHWNLFVEELDPRKLYADLKSEGLLGDQDGIEMLKIVSRKDRMIFLLERLDALKEPGLGYELLLDHCREHDEYVLQKIMEKEQLQASSKPQEQSTSTGWMSDQKLMFSATIILSVHRKASTVGMKNTGPECDKEFEITCLDVLDPVCYFDNMGEDMEGDDDLQEIFMKLEQVREPEEEKIAIKTKQPCLKRKRNMQIDA